MGQVYDIPYSALIAALLLKKREISYQELRELDRQIRLLDRNFYVIDDEYCTLDIPNIYGIVIEEKNSFCLRESFQYNTVIENLSVREILERCATCFGSDVLLDFVGYQRLERKKEDGSSSLVKSKKLFWSFGNKRVRVGV